MLRSLSGCNRVKHIWDCGCEADKWECKCDSAKSAELPPGWPCANAGLVDTPDKRLNMSEHEHCCSTWHCALSIDRLVEGIEMVERRWKVPKGDAWTWRGDLDAATNRRLSERLAKMKAELPNQVGRHFEVCLPAHEKKTTYNNELLLQDRHRPVLQRRLQVPARDEIPQLKRTQWEELARKWQAYDKTKADIAFFRDWRLEDARSRLPGCAYADTVYRAITKLEARANALRCPPAAGQDYATLAALSLVRSSEPFIGSHTSNSVLELKAMQSLFDDMEIAFRWAEDTDMWKIWKGRLEVALSRAKEAISKKSKLLAGPVPPMVDLSLSDFSTESSRSDSSRSTGGARARVSQLGGDGGGVDYSQRSRPGQPQTESSVHGGASGGDGSDGRNRGGGGLIGGSGAQGTHSLLPAGSDLNRMPTLTCDRKPVVRNTPVYSSDLGPTRSSERTLPRVSTNSRNMTAPAAVQHPHERRDNSSTDEPRAVIRHQAQKSA